MRQRRWLLGALVGVLASGVAYAQVPAEEVDERVGVDDGDGLPPLNVQLNAGISDFTGNLGDRSEVGPLLGVTVDARRYDFLGVEVGYEGTRNEVSEAFDSTGDGAIWRHNASALLKGGPRIDNFLPFVGAGVGLSYVNVNDEAETEAFENDVLGEIPLAAGVDYRVGNLAAGIRGTYRVLFNEEFAEDTGADTGGNALQGSLTLGGRF